MKIPVPRQGEVERISFYAAPPFGPTDTAYEMLQFLMQQPWADIKRANGGVVVADLRGGAGQGRVVASFTYAPAINNLAGGDKLEHEVAQVLQFRPRREKAPT